MGKKAIKAYRADRAGKIRSPMRTVEIRLGKNKAVEYVFGDYKFNLNELIAMFEEALRK